MQVRLAGKTLRGKNRVREHGEVWTVRDRGRVFFDGKESEWLLVEAGNGKMWVKVSNDFNFFLEVLE